MINTSPTLYDKIEELYFYQLLGKRTLTEVDFLGFYKDGFVSYNVKFKFFAGYEIGQCFIRFKSNQYMEITALKIYQDFRNLGYGSEVFSALIEHVFKKHNLQYASLYVEESNPRACEFYEKLGFEKDELQKFSSCFSMRLKNNNYKSLIKE